MEVSVRAVNILPVAASVPVASFALYLIPKQKVVVAEFAGDREHSARLGVPVKWTDTETWHHIVPFLEAARGDPADG